MRALILTAAVAAAPAICQAEGGVWYLDVHRVSPTLEGHFKGTQDGEPVDFDIVKDLALAKKGSKLGGSLEYQGPRFGLELSVEAQDYAGSNLLSRDVTISGETYHAQAQVVTSVKLVTYTFNWTIRFVRTPGAWLGLDLGVRGASLDLDAAGTDYLASQTRTASFKSGLPMPQVGPSAGYTGLDGRLALRGYYHLLAYKGATYHHAGGDVRFFPLKWLGVRAFFANETWKVPDNSLAKDLEIGLDRSGAGFGAVIKF